MQAQTILDFWFKESSAEQWFSANDAFDQLIQQRFGPLHQIACAGELFHWRHSAEGRLAEILVLDQFSRNIYRNEPRAFAQDSLALVLAQEAVSQQLDQKLQPYMRAFMYLPYMHSESPLIHEAAIRLFTALGIEGNLHFEKLHKAVIDRFGRYPHRNAILGRTSTPEEIEFLQQPNSHF